MIKNKSYICLNTKILQMNEELKNKLIAALEAKGLGKGLADFITITEESEIEGVVAKAIEALKPVEKTKEQKLADKEVQSEIDRRVTEALKKRDASEPPKKDDAPPSETSELLKELVSQNKLLAEKITAIESGKITDTKQQQAQKALQSSQVLTDSLKEKWVNRIDLNSDVSFEDQVKGLETEFSELRQTVVDSTPLSGSVPISTVNGKASDAEIDSIVGEFKI